LRGNLAGEVIASDLLTSIVMIEKGLNHVTLSGLEVKITDPRHFEFIIGNTVDLW